MTLFKRIPYQENLNGKEGYIVNVFTIPEFGEQWMAKLGHSLKWYKIS